MRPLILLSAILIPFLYAQDWCCPRKNVGGKVYNLVSSDVDGSKWGCSDNCAYAMEGDMNMTRKFCFRPGKFESKCDSDFTGMPGGGSMGTGMPGGGGMTTGMPGGGGMTGGAGGPTGAVPSNDDYCAKNTDHTMCKYSGPSAECAAKTEIRELSAAAKQAILDLHNDLRKKVAKGEETNGINPPQPGATNMRKMVWNTELEAIAQRWADQCNFGHDTIRDKLDGTSVGQNAYWGGNSQQEAEAAVQAGMTKAAQAWYDEIKDPGFDSQSIKPFVFSYGAGHYTQVVWAESEELGCGMVYYKGSSFWETLVVCNYAVAGNLQGGAMYTPGTACSDCPAGYTCDDGLCSKA